MDVRAAVAFAPGKPLEVTTVQLDGPRAGEILLEIKATGVCHTDEFTLSGADPEGLFPSILGHEGAGVVVEIGAGVTSVKKGDHVIPHIMVGIDYRLQISMLVKIGDAEGTPKVQPWPEGVGVPDKGPI